MKHYVSNFIGGTLFGLLLIALLLFATVSCKKDKDAEISVLKKELPGTYQKQYASGEEGKYNEYIITRDTFSNDSLFRVFHKFTRVDKKGSAALVWIPYLGDIIGDEFTLHYSEIGTLKIHSYEAGSWYEGEIQYTEKKETIEPGVVPWRAVNPNTKVLIMFEPSLDDGGWIISTPQNGDSFLFKKK